jgi:hypothetical protein
MKKTIVIAFLSATLFSCTTTNEKPATAETATVKSSCVREGAEIDLMKKVITAYSNGDWATFASYFSDTAKSYYNADTVASTMADRIANFKKQRETLDGNIDSGEPNLEVVTLENGKTKWGHAWITFKSKSKAGVAKRTLTFVSFGIRDGKILMEHVIYDTK